MQMGRCWRRVLTGWIWLIALFAMGPAQSADCPIALRLTQAPGQVQCLSDLRVAEQTSANWRRKIGEVAKSAPAWVLAGSATPAPQCAAFAEIAVYQPTLFIQRDRAMSEVASACPKGCECTVAIMNGAVQSPAIVDLWSKSLPEFAQPATPSPPSATKETNACGFNQQIEVAPGKHICITDLPVAKMKLAKWGREVGDLVKSFRNWSLILPKEDSAICRPYVGLIEFSTGTGPANPLFGQAIERELANCPSQCECKLVVSQGRSVDVARLTSWGAPGRQAGTEVPTPTPSSTAAALTAVTPSNSQTQAREQERLAQEARAREQERLAQEARLREQERLAQEARAREQERLAQEARLREQERLAQEARAREQERLAQEARLREQERLAQEARAREQERLAQEARLREQERLALEARAREEENQRLRLELARLQQEARKAPEPSPLAPPPLSNRKALVIGNDNYKNVSKLMNAREDARAMAQSLEKAGYRVLLRLDLSEREMKSVMRMFKGMVEPGDEVAIFYAGHGVQLGAVNYLLPTDVGSDSEDQVRDEAIPLQRVLDDMNEKRVKFTLAIMDACRDNPFKPTVAGRSIGAGTRGLAPTAAATGQMIVFSAGQGQQALDRLGDKDTSRNGLFTRVFVQEMLKPGVPIDRVVKNVRNEVSALAKSIGHEQVPAIYDQVLGDFYFVRRNTP